MSEIISNSSKKATVFWTSAKNRVTIHTRVNNGVDGGTL